MNRFFTLLLAASCLTAAGQVPDYVPTEGLVAWYPFNGNANDESQYANHGTVVGASLTEDRFGLPHSAFSFDGNDHIESPHAEWLNHGSNSYSWGGWALNSGTPGWGHLLTKAIHTANPYSGKSRWLRTGGDSFLALAEGEAGNGYTDQGNGVVCQIESIGNEWFHLIGVIDKESEMKVASIYLNGQLLCSAEIADSSYVSDQEGMLVFGCEDPYINLPSGPQYFVGKLDDLGIWNRALSSEEIQGLFDGIPPTVGCTDENACNFNPAALVDDGSCTLADCTDPQACNFNSEAACDGGNCVYAPTIDLGQDIVSCEELVLLEAQDGQFFQWSTGESDSIIEVSQTGFYAVEASSQLGEPNVIAGHTFIGRLGQSDYYISEASISWEDARTQSESLGGHLVVITSPEENELVWQGVYGNGLNPGGTNNYQAWIGLYQEFESPDYSEPNGGWRWVTDESVSYLNWAANRPGNMDQGYFVHMTDANGNCPEGDIVCGTWDDSGISANLQSAFYVLEVESPYGSCTTSDSVFVEFNHGSCFCGPGTMWNEEMQLCIGDGSGDINLDGCVQLNDLLDLLSAYGDCGAEEEASGFALSFDGVNDHVDFGNASLGNVEDVTFEVLMKTGSDSEGLGSNYQALLSKDCNGCEFSTGDWAILIGHNGNGVASFTINNSSGVAAVESGALNDEEWHWISVTRNATTGLVHLYVDGVEVDSDIGPVGLVHNEEKMYLAKYFLTSPSHYEGLIGEFRVWNRELTDIEIGTYLGAELQGNESGLVGLWNFSEGEGDVLTDQTNGGLNGQIIEATWTPATETP